MEVIIKIKLNSGKEIELTEYEYDELKDKFKEQILLREYIPYPTYPQYPNNPYWYDTNPFYNPNYIYCSDTANIETDNYFDNFLPKNNK